MTHIGFTGTQRGMTRRQYIAVRDFLTRGVYATLPHQRFYAHHGDCVGADAQFHAIARGFGDDCAGIVIHPCDITAKRARCVAIPPYDVVRPVKKPLDRNRDIVAESDVLIATPKEDHMQIRSGTWTTVRYALEAAKPVAVVLPSGAVVYDGARWPDGDAAGGTSWPI